MAVRVANKIFFGISSKESKTNTNNCDKCRKCAKKMSQMWFEDMKKGWFLIEMDNQSKTSPLLYR